MTKQQMLPPAGTPKREALVNLRFSSEDHERLKHIADYRDTTVGNLLFYVIVNTMLPLMEKEMNKELSQASRRSQTQKVNPSVFEGE